MRAAAGSKSESVGGSNLPPIPLVTDLKSCAPSLARPRWSSAFASSRISGSALVQGPGRLCVRVPNWGGRGRGRVEVGVKCAGRFFQGRLVQSG
eukprot:3583153-Rhodomonas_salina.9